MKRSLALVTAVAAFAMNIAAAHAQNPAVKFAVPTTALNFTFTYVAQAIDAWKKEGLDVDVQLIAGLGSTNALLSGSVEFSSGSGPTMIAANARGQKPFIIGTPSDKIPFEIVVSKAIADAVDPKAPIEKRAAALKGKTIAIDAVNSIQQGYVKYILAKAGLDPDKDVTFTPMAPTAVVAALQAGRIDAFSSLAPWSTQAVKEGIGVLYVSSPRGDLAELNPFLITTLVARAGYCEQNADICKKFLKGVQTALTFIQEQPDKVLDILKAKFKDMDPALLKSGFEDTRTTYTKVLKVEDKALQNAEMLALTAGILKPEEKRKTPFSEIYSNAYQP